MTPSGDHPIVVFGDDWGRHVSTMQHVFRRIVGRRQVFWVNAIGHRLPEFGVADFSRAAGKLRRAFAQPASEQTPADETLLPEAIIDPRVLPWHHWAPVHRFNTWSLTREIQRTLEQHGATDPPILVTGSPPSVGVLGQLGEIASVYFCMDDFLHHPDATAHMIAPLERRLLEQVDALVATAQHLTEIKVPASGQTRYLPQGVNYEHFAELRPVPAELADLPRPLIGFAGGVSDCCDYPLLQRIAQTWPEASIVFVGPITVEDEAVAALRLPNVHFLGPKPYQDLPAYVQAFDVGIIPYVLNEWTRAVDPLKLLEYLAAGIPVVTTDIPEVLKYGDVVAVAASHDDFLEAISSVLSGRGGGTREERQHRASANTWTSRADQLLDILDQLTSQDRPVPAATHE